MKPDLKLVDNPEYQPVNPESVKAVKEQLFRTRRYLEMKRRSPEANWAEIDRQRLARFG